MLDRNCFGKTRKSKLPLPSLPTASRAKTVIGVFRSWSQSRAKNATRSAGSAAAGGEAAILAIADAHARFGVRRGHAIDDHLRAAVVDVMELRQHGELRRRQPNLERASRRRGRLPQAEQHGPHRRHVHLRFACLQIRQHALARGAREADLVAGRRQLGCRRRRELENRRGAIALHERDRESRQRAARGRDRTAISPVWPMTLRPPISMAGPSALPALTHSAAAPTPRSTRTTSIFHMAAIVPAARVIHTRVVHTRFNPWLREEIAMSRHDRQRSLGVARGRRDRVAAASSRRRPSRAPDSQATTARVLWQPSMNVFRRFEVPAERMYEFYGGVLGFKQLSTMNVGNGGGVARFQAGAQELKLTRRVGDRHYEPGGVSAATGLAATDVLLRRRGGARRAFRAARAAVAGVRRPAAASRSALVTDPDGQQVELVIVPGATAEQLARIEVGLTVADIERSRAFYRSFVGLEELPPVRRRAVRHAQVLVSARCDDDQPAQLRQGVCRPTPAAAAFNTSCPTWSSSMRWPRSGR